MGTGTPVSKEDDVYGYHSLICLQLRRNRCSALIAHGWRGQIEDARDLTVMLTLTPDVHQQQAAVNAKNLPKMRCEERPQSTADLTLNGQPLPMPS